MSVDLNPDDLKIVSRERLEAEIRAMKIEQGGTISVIKLLVQSNNTLIDALKAASSEVSPEVNDKFVKAIEAADAMLDYIDVATTLFSTLASNQVALYATPEERKAASDPISTPTKFPVH